MIDWSAMKELFELISGEIFHSTHTYVERRCVLIELMNNQSHTKYSKQMHREREMSNSSRNMSHRLECLMKDDVIQKGNKTNTSVLFFFFSPLALNCYYQGYLFFLAIYIPQFKVDVHLAISSFLLFLLLGVEQIFFPLSLSRARSCCSTLLPFARS